MKIFYYFILLSLSRDYLFMFQYPSVTMGNDEHWNLYGECHISHSMKERKAEKFYSWINFDNVECKEWKFSWFPKYLRIIFMEKNSCLDFYLTKLKFWKQFEEEKFICFFTRIVVVLALALKSQFYIAHNPSDVVFANTLVPILKTTQKHCAFVKINDHSLLKNATR